MRAFDKASFEVAMCEIDEALRHREIDISDRCFAAIAKFVKRYHVQIPLCVSPLSSDAPYTPEFLAAHIGSWYERLHVERLVTRSLSIGRMALLIRNDLWVVRVPVIVGGPFCWVACSRHVVEEQSLDNGQYSIFQSFDGMSSAYRADLLPAKLEVVLNLFSLGERALCLLWRVAPTDLIRAARADHDAAVEHLAAPHPHSGLSRWASLQAVEKLLKAFLSSRQASFPSSHNLATLKKPCRSGWPFASVTGGHRAGTVPARRALWRGTGVPSRLGAGSSRSSSRQRGYRPGASSKGRLTRHCGEPACARRWTLFVRRSRIHFKQ